MGSGTYGDELERPSSEKGQFVDDADPLVPEGVHRGIEDIAEGNTASAEDIESVLKF